MIQFLADNWLWIVLAGGFVWMHTGHRGCGSHGHDEQHARDSASEASEDPDHHHVV